MGTGIQRLALFFVVVLMCTGLPGCGGSGDSPQTGSPPPVGGKTSELIPVGQPFNLAAGAKTGQISVDVPAGTSSVTFIADGGNTTADIDIEDVVTPTGNLIVGRRKTLKDLAGKNQLHVADDTLASGTFWNPLGPAISAGTWKFNVASYNAPATVQVYASLNRRENPTGGTLDVNLIFCGIPGINKDNALAEPNFQVMFNEFKRIYAQANIQVKVAGTFNCNNASELTVLETKDEYRELLMQSSITGNQAMNFFFVQGFTQPEFPEGLLGKAGKIEGPALLQGTPYSGVVIATALAGFSALSQAELLNQGATMAHEGGHFFGLYHPTEQCGAGATECLGADSNENGQIDPWEIVDPIQDTPECPSSLSIFDPLVGFVITAENCSAFDGKNLMFWSRVIPSDSFTQDQLTAGQKFVLHVNPYIH